MNEETKPNSIQVNKYSFGPLRLSVSWPDGDARWLTALRVGLFAVGAEAAPRERGRREVSVWAETPWSEPRCRQARVR